MYVDFSHSNSTWPALVRLFYTSSEKVPLCIVKPEVETVKSILPPVGNFFPCFGLFFAISFFLWVRLGVFPMVVSSFLFLSILSLFCLHCCGSFSDPLFLFFLLHMFFFFTLSFPSSIFRCNLASCC